MRHVESWFWAICLAATLLGLFVPEAGAPLRGLILPFLGGIMYFTGLKLDFGAARRELARPSLALYASAMRLALLPLAVFALARAVLPPEYAAGVLIVAAMPAGMACSALSDVVGGSAALALVITLVSSLLCPLVTPLVVGVGAAPAAGTGGGFFARQAAFLAAALLSPLAAAWLTRRFLPGVVARLRGACTGLSILSLALLILAAMSASSADFLALLRGRPALIARLTGFMFAFSALLHAAGLFMAPWRGLADRAALSVSMAYVNNALAIVFATRFYRSALGSAAVLPAILLEVPMILALLPLRVWARRRAAAGPHLNAGPPRA